jgi:4-hydroxybenzoyl-CoA thioesterase
MENSFDIEVRFGECDPYQIVFYPTFYVWFDHCMWKLLEAAGLPPHVLRRDYGFDGMPLVDARCRFVAPARFGDILTIKSRVESWGRSSFKVAHRVFKDDTLIAEGQETRVWTAPHPDDPKRIAARPVPRGVIDRLGGIVAAGS